MYVFKETCRAAASCCASAYRSGGNRRLSLCMGVQGGCLRGPILAPFWPHCNRLKAAILLGSCLRLPTCCRRDKPKAGGCAASLQGSQSAEALEVGPLDEQGQPSKVTGAEGPALRGHQFAADEPVRLPARLQGVAPQHDPQEPISGVAGPGYPCLPMAHRAQADPHQFGHVLPALAGEFPKLPKLLGGDRRKTGPLAAPPSP